MPDDFGEGFAGGIAAGGDALVVDVDGFEGPLDLLLTLARSQKVDLRRVSILGLAERYLAFVSEARRLRIELAADYLVMAAWLAFLKSRLLLPPDPAAPGPSAQDLADHLAFQLERLEGMRRVAARLMGRDQLGRDIFARGLTEPVIERRRVIPDATLVDLLRAYARVKTREDYAPLHVRREPVYTMEQALARLRGMLGMAVDWRVLEAFLPEGWALDPRARRSATAATFAAMLELVKAGVAELRQDGVFAPLMLRARAVGPHLPHG